MSLSDRAVAPDTRLPARAWRAAEASLLFVVAPIVHVAFFDILGVFAPLAVVTAAGVLLLAITPGWRWRELVAVSSLRGHGRLILGFTVVAAGVIFALVFALIPYRLFGLPRHMPETWALVMVFYPLVSVLGQELLFRPLFFRRYGDLFAGPVTLVLANAGVFSLTHAFYQNWIALTLTFLGGLIFAEVYRRSRSFPLVFVLHTLAGQLIFTSGLGVYFYHGAIPQ
ncbi:CPBP family intramembrane glutamic endopeptidase [Rhodovibrio salinarum]|uniref:CPBP family intramembrane metalloprotease n=1 Tax=Rhodovibrio salinarum TaxID=1087 RepID=A0A934QGG5_9PROT|nr:CPBP family intramembrane glutamic endopeptidase [Rhodovibrio salinarum]MBK1696060.1 CPBP family intramembrane metalloprotease [Rhodovibrio salinarum]